MLGQRKDKPISKAKNKEQMLRVALNLIALAGSL